MNFKKFTDQAERMEKGLISYDRAADFGVTQIHKLTALALKYFRV